MHARDYFRTRRQCNHRKPRGLDRLAPAFVTVNDSKHPGHCTAAVPYGRDCPERRAPGRDDILHDRYAIASDKWTLDETSSSMGFGLLSDGKSPYQMSRGNTSIGDRISHRVGAHGQSTD